MKIIAFEAIDAAGKHTQTMLAKKKLEEAGYKVYADAYPIYTSETGKIIRKYLDGEITFDPIVFECVQAANKREHQKLYKQLEKDGYDIVLIDRYIDSQVCYGLANGFTPEFTLNLLSGIRVPDLNIVIDIPSEVSMSRKSKFNGGIKDTYERNKEMLDMARHFYVNTQCTGQKIIVDGTQSIEEIHNEIIDAIDTTLILAARK